MKKHILKAGFAGALAWAAMGFSALATVPEGYYDSLEGKSGVALMQAVQKLAANHVVISYGEADPNNPFNPVTTATWTVFLKSDTRTVNDNIVWWDMYSDINRRVQDGHTGLNIEHSVPNSWWSGEKNAAYKDIHHLNPSDATANSAKGNYALGEVSGTTYFSNGVSTIGNPKSGQGGGSSRVYEPADVYKGDFARAFFYVFATYPDINWQQETAYMYDLTSNLMLQPWACDMLLAWAKADPVSYKELERNDIIYAYQKNRNPFIDCPQLADHIWGSKKNEAFHYALYTPANPDPNYPGWDAPVVEMIPGQWQPLLSNDELDEETTYVLVSPKENKAMTYTQVSTNKAFNQCLYGPDRDLKTYPDVLTALPEEIAYIHLQKTDGDGWYVAVHDTDDNFVGYISVSENNTAKLAATPTANCIADINITASKADIMYLVNDKETFLSYNKNNTRFASYPTTSNMLPVMLYRPVDEPLFDPEEPDDPEDPGNAGIGGTGLDENADEVITAIFDINGRKVNASSVSGLDKGIYIVVSNFGVKKIRR
ncbi:MAG: endonuclease [Muribaculaceae bacterium]|nr:endonuclease [Muribaculaceae bacterium]